MVAGGWDFKLGAQRGAIVLDAPFALAKTGSLVLGRNFPTATLLAPGRVLVTGGFGPAGSIAEAEIWDAAAGAFTRLTSTLAVGREAHTATRLPDGQVLVAGGLQAQGFMFHASTDLFDPGTNAFRKRPDLGMPRAFHVAIPWGSKVALLGGATGPQSETASTELVDPAGASTPLGARLAHASKALAAAPLADGRSLVAGGADGTDKTLADAVLSSPDSGKLEPAAPMGTRRMAFALTTLADGRVLASGGWSDTEMPAASIASLEVFDPRRGAWTALPIRLAQARHDHVAVQLADCRVAIFGGQQVTAASPTAPLEIGAVTMPTRH